MNEFFTILTAVGRNRLANATATGTNVNLTQFRLGDGGGSMYTPTESQTNLRREVWRGNVTMSRVDPQNPNWIVIEVDVPASDGGFMIREAGIFDSTGVLIAIARYPETYKPKVSEGSAKELKVRMVIEVSNASSVTLNLNPNVITVTQKDMEEAISDVKIGGRNYALGTERVSEIVGGGGTNQTLRAYHLSRRSGIESGLWNSETRTHFVISFDWEVIGEAKGDFVLQTAGSATTGGTYYKSITGRIQLSETNRSGRHIHTGSLQSEADSSMVGWRLDNVPVGTKIKIWNLKLEKGNKATDWSPAIEDFTTETVLWSGGISVEGSEITLADDVSKYTHLKIYGRFHAGGQDYVLGEYLASRDGYVIRDIDLGDDLGDMRLSVAECFLLRQGRVMALGRNQRWSWSGNISNNATKQNTSSLVTITRIVGVRV